MSFANSILDRFRQMPIRGKLRIVIFLSILLALFLAGAGIIVAELALSYNALQRDLATFVQIIGDNSTGALAFNDANAANQTLAALRARTHVETACLYQKDGTQLGVYRRSAGQAACPGPQGELIRREGRVVLVSHPISLAGSPLGTLVLRYDLEELADRVQLYSGLVLFSLIVSSALALGLSSRLRTLIAEPILQLASAAERIALTKDYRIRAGETSQDEVGVLSRALNQMLDAIQSRDNDLLRALDSEQEAVKRLAWLNADLQRSHQDLERVAFLASHDLQEPLRMITAYSQLLIAEAVSTESAAGFVKHIVDGTGRMRALLADLLAYAEISSTSVEAPGPVDLNLVVAAITDRLKPQILENHAEIVSEALPVVSGHPNRMTSVFENLIANALKYRSALAPRVWIAARDSGEYVEFSVADNGIGIAPEFHKKIFIAFKRLHGREIPGTGIGLAICQRVVELYGGSIWVESNAGSGSTFRFTLPKSRVEKAR